MIVEAQSILGLFIATAARFPKKIAIKISKRKQLDNIPWEHFFESVRSLALGLRGLGLKPQETVCLLASNRFEWLCCDLAVLSNRAILVPLYTNCSDGDFEYIITHSEAKYLIVENASYLERYNAIKRKKRDSIQHIIVMDTNDMLCGDNVCAYDAVITKGYAQHEIDATVYSLMVDSVTSEDIATIVYTSGTTGEPKGVMISHGNVVSNCRGCGEVIAVSTDDVSLSFLPLSHIFERLAGYYFFLFSGATITFTESMFSVMKDLKEIRPTVMCAVPRFFERVYHGVLDQIDKKIFWQRALFQWALRVGRSYYAFKRRGRDITIIHRILHRLFQRSIYRKVQQSVGGNLRFFISGGAALNQNIAYFFQAVGITILEGYGLTETSPVVAVNREDTNRIGTVGFPLPNVEVKICDDGEIAVRGPSVMKGYFKAPEATADVLHEGWLLTGDIGRLDAQGYLKIIDRKKDIIVLSGGKNISPQGIESVFIADKLFNQIVVFGDDKKYLVALIVPDQAQVELYAAQHHIECSCFEELIEDKAIHALFKKRINVLTKDFAVYEKIKRFKLLQHEFTLANGELTPTFKIRRKIIFQKYRHVIDALYR